MVTQLRTEGRDLNAASTAVEVQPRRIKETTYTLQVPVWYVERMEVLQTLRDIKQLPCVRIMKSVIHYSYYGDGVLPHQRRSICARMRRNVLIDITILRPVINEREPKERHGHAAKR